MAHHTGPKATKVGKNVVSFGSWWCATDPKRSLAYECTYERPLRTSRYFTLTLDQSGATSPFGVTTRPSTRGCTRMLNFG